ncbi:MAG: hypothetical protein JW952_08850 [Candidatus Eisenbacteria bacterium]|nr:hypothetical protein [Candidatus Eisenbacteria bacterium]
MYLTRAFHRSPENQWVLTYYDSEGTSYYPIPSRALRPGATLQVLWKIPVSGLGNLGVARVRGFDTPLVLLCEEQRIRLIDGRGEVRWIKEVFPGNTGALDRDTGALDWDQDGLVDLVVTEVHLDTVWNCTDAWDALLIDNLGSTFDPRSAAQATADSMRIERREISTVISTSGDTLLSVPRLLPLHWDNLKTAYPSERNLTLRAFGPGYPASDRYSRLLLQPIRIEDGEGRPSIQRYLSRRLVRRIEAIEAPSGRIRWAIPVPFFPHLQAIADVNVDELPDIIVGGYCPENGCAESGMVDVGQITVLAAGISGEILWTQVFPGDFAGARACVADVLGDSDPEVVVVVHNWRMNRGTLAVLDGSSGRVLRRKQADFSFCGLSAVDTDDDGKKEVFVGSTEGTVFRVDGDLRLLSSRQIVLKEDGSQFPCCLVQAANDVDGDGDIEIVCIATPRGGGEWDPSRRLDLAYGVERLVVLGSDCRVEWDIPLGSPDAARDYDSSEGFLAQHAVLGDLDADGVNEILCRTRTEVIAFGFRSQ